MSTRDFVCHRFPMALPTLALAIPSQKRDSVWIMQRHWMRVNTEDGKMYFTSVFIIRCIKTATFRERSWQPSKPTGTTSSEISSCSRINRMNMLMCTPRCPMLSFYRNLPDLGTR